METSRKHGSFDMRWPCARTRRSTALPIAPTVPDGSAVARPRLTLVPTEPMQPAALLAQERELAGTQRLLAAMAAQRATEEGT
jgi:hypothetical protein